MSAARTPAGSAGCARWIPTIREVRRCSGTWCRSMGSGRYDEHSGGVPDPVRSSGGAAALAGRSRAGDHRRHLPHAVGMGGGCREAAARVRPPHRGLLPLSGSEAGGRVPAEAGRRLAAGPVPQSDRQSGLHQYRDRKGFPGRRSPRGGSQDHRGLRGRALCLGKQLPEPSLDTQNELCGTSPDFSRGPAAEGRGSPADPG